MAEPNTTTTTTEEKPFDSKAFIAAQNEKHAKPGQPVVAAAAAETKKVEPPAAAAAAATPAEGEKPRLSRAERRAQNRLREELGEERGRRLALEEQVAKLTGGKPAEGAAAAKPAEASSDPEPQQTDFTTYTEYDAAHVAWLARGEARKTVSETLKAGDETKAFQKQLSDMAAKAVEDKKAFEDWDEVAKAAAEDGPEFNVEDHPQLMMLIGVSDVQASILYHFGKNPEELEKMLELSKKPQEQIRAFHRLEGRMEKLYEKPAAQAAGEKKPPEDRKPPEKAGEARATAVDRDVHKPRPSAEVTARGGTPAAEEPPIGSKAWMARRNQSQFSR